MRRLLFFAPAVVFVVLVGLFLSQLVLGRDPAIIPSALLDQPVPEFTLSGIEGRAGADGCPTAFRDNPTAGSVT